MVRCKTTNCHRAFAESESQHSIVTAKDNTGTIRGSPDAFCGVALRSGAADPPDLVFESKAQIERVARFLNRAVVSAAPARLEVQHPPMRPKNQ